MPIIFENACDCTHGFVILCTYDIIQEQGNLQPMGSLQQQELDAQQGLQQWQGNSLNSRNASNSTSSIKTFTTSRMPVILGTAETVGT
jgi:hypothetical protein